MSRTRSGMSLTPNIKTMPDVSWEYWGLVTFMLENPFMYGTEEKRVECHDRLCEHYKLSKEITKSVTDHLDKFDHAVDMHTALLKLKKAENQS